jgi:hypothetical protein
MEKNRNQKSLLDWVDARLVRLSSAGLSDTDAARALIRFHQHAQRRRRARTLVAVSAAVLVLLALPSTRGLAQRLWNRIFLNGHVVIRTTHFEETGIVASSKEGPVADISEAAARVGFVPRLPAPEVLAGFPPEPAELRVTDFAAGEMTIRVADIVARLQRAGLSPADIFVPPEWDGTVIRFPGGQACICCLPFAEYGGRAAKTSSVTTQRTN